MPSITKTPRAIATVVFLTPSFDKARICHVDRAGVWRIDRTRENGASEREYEGRGSEEAHDGWMRGS